MRAHFGLMCVVACGVAAGVMLWRDHGPAGQPAQPPRARARSVEPERASRARPGPRPSLDDIGETRAPAPVRARTPGPAPGGPPPGDDDETATMRALVRESLMHDIPRKLPELRLSPEDLERLTDAMLRVRAHSLRLRSLAHDASNASEIRRLEERLVHDLLIFEEVTGMSATELTGALSDEGVTTEEQAHATKPVYWTLPE